MEQLSFQSKLMNQTCFNQDFSNLSHDLIESVERVLLTSDYAVRQREIFKQLLIEDDCLETLSAEVYRKQIQTIPLTDHPDVFAKSLRQFRHRHLLRLYLREQARLSNTEETMRAWSYCADALIAYALAHGYETLKNHFGEPCDDDGHISQLFTIAMGKLGGYELNFSSDIDLIFVFSASGFTNGQESIPNQLFFEKLVKHFTQLMQNKTADGFVFRVDLRLRPNGDSAPLVCSLTAMEAYYQEQGRDWERYAMVKARLINPLDATANSEWFHQLISPFVYRRYVDFSVIESLRSLKSMIEREIHLNPMLDDIKRGQGGIREVEFIIQCFQLIRGGRLPQLQQQNALLALTQLKRLKLLAHTDVLKQAYLFLRQLENCLQIRQDQQTHQLPSDAMTREQIAFAMQYPSWQKLADRLQQYRRIICRAFSSVLGMSHHYEDELRVLSQQLNNLWQGHVEPGFSVNFLASLGFKQPERCFQMLSAFRHSPRCKRLSQISRIRLDRLMVLLLQALKHTPKTDHLLLQVLHLLEAIVGRSAYLALLTENPNGLDELLYWFAHSPFIASLFVQQPFLLEILVDQTKAWRPLSRQALTQSLAERLSYCENEEDEDEVLRQFKLRCWLLAARSELYGHCSAQRISQFLADVAEVIIIQVATLAYQRLSQRYPTMLSIQAQFAILAYGKLGAREMNYDSDIDLVFLHQVQTEQEPLINRLTQKILHMLTMRLQSGVLYPVDTRLRPSGEAGLLVSRLDAFIEYQQHQAWTWEHQALLRARLVFGKTRFKQSLKQLKQNVFLKERDVPRLAHDIVEMGDKIKKIQSYETIKYATGGLLDLEFLVQFLMLAHPLMQSVTQTNTAKQLALLFQNQILSEKEYDRLLNGYRCFHRVLHHQVLRSTSEPCKKERVHVSMLCDFFYHSANKS